MGKAHNPSLCATDKRGSVIAVSNSAGTSIGLNKYDEYGIPLSTNMGRFGYTGQAFIPELGLWYYKARMYSATLGRFMQTDPIGYKDGINWYAYTGNDPVNSTDPDGQQMCTYVCGNPPPAKSDGSFARDAWQHRGDKARAPRQPDMTKQQENLRQGIKTAGKVAEAAGEVADRIDGSVARNLGGAAKVFGAGAIVTDQKMQGKTNPQAGANAIGQVVVGGLAAVVGGAVGGRFGGLPGQAAGAIAATSLTDAIGLTDDAGAMAQAMADMPDPFEACPKCMDSVPE